MTRSATAIRRWFESLNRVDILAACLLITLSAVLWPSRLRGPLDLRWDGAAYYTLGTSLRELHSYRLLNEPGRIEAVQYPPLFPAVIAAYQLLFRTTDPNRIGHCLRITFAFVSVAYILVVYLVLRSRLSPPYALIAGLIALTNPTAISISDFCLSDIPFAFLVASFFFIRRWFSGSIGEVVAWLTATAAYLMRTMGMTLMGAWIFESVLHQAPKKAAVRFMLSLLPVIAWQLYVHHVESQPDYRQPSYAYQRDDSMYYNVSYARNISLVNPFLPKEGYLTASSLTHRVVHNIRHIPRLLGETVSPRLDLWSVPLRLLHVSGFVRRAFMLFLQFVPIGFGCLILCGLAFQLWKREWLTASFVAFSLALTCLLPFPRMLVRYMIPLVPFVALPLFELVQWIRARSQFQTRRWQTIFTAAITLMISLCLLQAPFFIVDLFKFHHEEVRYRDWQHHEVSYRLFYYDEPCRALDAGIDWLEDNAHPNDIVATSMPHWVFLRSGLTTVMPPFEPNPDKLEALIDSVPVTYAILDHTLYDTPEDTNVYVRPVMRHTGWELVYRDARALCEIYRRKSAIEKVKSEAKCEE